MIKRIALKQHSPLLHFQHDQDGATLRATELKPKLDAMVIGRLFNDLDYRQLPEEGLCELLKQQHAHWLVGGGHAKHPALDYKLRIKAQLKESYLVASNIPGWMKSKLDKQGQAYLANAPYFADNDAIKKEELGRAKRGLVFENIQLEIICLDDELRKVVAEAVPYLLAYHNFGLRQSKGFGCFSVYDQTKADFEQLLKEHPDYKKAMANHFERERRPPSAGKILSAIDKEYKILKSGLQRDRSQMEEYFQQKGIEWEKPIIKTELVKNRGSIRGSGDYTQDKKRKYVRALLGVAELYEFPKNGGEKITVACTDKDNDQPGGLQVERFRSPITFKLFESSAYLLPELLPEEIYGKTFSFTNRRKMRILLETPPLGSFDLPDFLKKHVDNDWNYV